MTDSAAASNFRSSSQEQRGAGTPVTAEMDEADLTKVPPFPTGSNAERISGPKRWVQSVLVSLAQATQVGLRASRLKPVAFSFADQALAVGGGFLANVALARTGTKEEYGMFALSYSMFTFVSGLHNAAILEPFTVYGSGRYHERFPSYLRLMARSNLVFGLLLNGLVLLACLVFSRVAPHLVSRALVGLGLTAGVLLSGIFMRRAFYVQRRPALAAKSSLVFFITVAIGLLLTLKLHMLNSLWVFLILALGWTVAGASYGRNLAQGRVQDTFLRLEPDYWRVHWRYARWVLVAAFVFQLMIQGYYWLVAGFLSVREVGELRAMYNLVVPMDQIFIALSYLVLPAMARHYATKRMDCLLSLWKRYAVAILGVTVFFALGLRLLGQQVMNVLYAGRFDGLAPLLSVLALLPLVTAVSSTMTQALNAAEKPKLVVYGFLSGGAATIALGIPLVIHYGLRGAVYGLLVSGVACAGTIAFGFFRVIYRKGVEYDSLEPQLR